MGLSLSRPTRQFPFLLQLQSGWFLKQHALPVNIPIHFHILKPHAEIDVRNRSN